MSPNKQLRKLPVVRLLGEVEHADFFDARSLLQETAELSNSSDRPPEVIIVAQCRPGCVDFRVVEELRSAAPLAGVVSLLGSWCEGETRTGRPLAGNERVFWYDFPSWWRRQLSLLDERRCPDWHRLEASRLRMAGPISGSNAIDGSRSGTRIVALQTQTHETGRALADILGEAGYASVQHPSGSSGAVPHRIAAGIWEGGQLSDKEAAHLFSFVGRLASQNAPVLALLDFPRRDAVDKALSLGAAAVIAKPWLNRDLIDTLRRISVPTPIRRAA
jgi:hypothetical protein